MRAEDALNAYYQSLNAESSRGNTVPEKSGFYRETLAGALLGIVVLCFLASSASELPKGVVAPRVVTKEQYAAMIGDTPHRIDERASKEIKTCVV